jgi:hypothetical protein
VLLPGDFDASRTGDGRMAAPPVVAELVERFDSHRDAYHSGSYNEAQLREEFLNPFFEALGWDIYNKKGYAEAYKEVIHEAAIKVGGRTKAPDYCFRAGGGVPSFFVEAKKPAVDVREALSPAYQLRRYAWSAKLPVSLLTDFEELAAYDCRIRPVKNDKASTARVIYHTYTEYLDCWDQLAGLFAPEAIRRGALDKFIASKRVKKGTAQVDDAFLHEIQSWREDLARNIALRNPDLSQRDLNFAVQRTIDRIVFLRICEDRGIEPYGTLQGLLNGPSVYRRLGELFQRADERYNSGLFYFTEEKGRGSADEMTLALAIDDKVLKDLLKRLYYPDSPYEFSVLPVEILGHVYEQFLGKVIRLTSGHRAKVEDKPEVKKAGGVYYTPTYIVDYIVRHTVGKLLEGKKPTQAAKLRILDPACGSGSFLIGAYEHLLTWHRDWYIGDDPERHARGRHPKLYRGRAGDWRLTTAERKRILLNNIYGVDIDPQAVEVTKLSLLLKVLEGESQQTLETQRRLFHERALPDLASNIKCGNSLIGPDFYKDRQMNVLDEEEIYRINAFDWQGEFPDIFNGTNPGFDAVIGNPPYVRQEGVSSDKDYFATRYSVYHGLADLYVYFYERALWLLRQGGMVGFITSSKFIHSGYGARLRSFLGSSCHVSQLIDYGDQQVFRGATTYPVIALALKTEPVASKTFLFGRCAEHTGLLPEAILAKAVPVPLSSLRSEHWVLASEAQHAVLKRIDVEGTALASVAGRAQLGIKTSLNEAFVIDQSMAQTLFAQDPACRDVVKPYGRGRDLEKWYATTNGMFLVCTRISLDIETYPAVKQYLLGFQAKLRARYEVRRGDYEWWVIRQVAETAIFDNPKIVYPDLCSRPTFALNEDGMYPNNTVFCIASDSGALLAYLNSTVAWFWIIHNCPANRGGAYRLFNQYMDRLPVHPSVLDNSDLHKLGRQMLHLQRKCTQSRTTHEKSMIERQMHATDRQIDRLVYELYELTDDEIKIVEESFES